MLSFIRSDLAQFNAYKPHPSSDTAAAVPLQLDRLDTNESPYDLPSELKEKLAWTYQQAIETNRYPDGGHETLKDAIAQYVNQSASLSPSVFTGVNISLGNGSDELIRSLLIATCLKGEGAILVANPTFSMYGILAKTLGIPVVTVDRNKDNFEIDLKAAQCALEQTQNPPIRVVFVVHPNSPTGNCLTGAELSWLRSLGEDILVVIDEAYFEFSQTTLVSELTQRPNWVILRTFSKAFRLAALRVGYCVAHPQAIAILEKVRLPYNLPSFSIAGALAAMENSQLLLESISPTLDERDKLIKVLSQHPKLRVAKSAANFIFLRLLANNSDTQNASLTNLHQKLKTSGTLVREISGGLRITIGTSEENIRTVNRIQAGLANLEF
ncbi:histidinol-phosphate transaminase [Umezakia ovalisporum]|jgi:histidinol-phosphate aminotransferase|uniref:Histidinol-phosphate aminotransferase n=2 Tax=Umezakia ovalisporum TaxID=75695 RepID=A0AA43GYQ4_9CYAN|nr:histidinol-phosphate transaminase [Umezakia ovalisporum]MBI1240502.1 histidinol-phosphate transaminase [Nostoc sp. RI_552]MDH6058746.1 histidinol-phosphate transaminase [Umezakia ovalisporum FSS-43]MDH6063692.1 histidinol-phosphate transaminase [Umezakia ovalisporum FSS-62]MDH6066612.1 histidinol-phosphate transaminase [Umezakia ovalisporum APH033B]MDH6072260.1 histidinol-phosphate transaminase [Umezakia ovalisporum CobakiLakeA]